MLAANDNRFPGQYYQLESGLNYNWHRQYDPGLDRYTQPDLLGLIDAPSRYAYVNSDPLQSVDPRGENLFRILNWLGNATKGLLRNPGRWLRGKRPRVPHDVSGIPDDSPAIPAGTIDQVSVKRPQCVPDEWVEMSSKKPGGKTFHNPNNRHDFVRVMRGNPQSNFPAQRQPYVVRSNNGTIVDVNGNPVGSKDPTAHIPLKDFTKLY